MDELLTNLEWCLQARSELAARKREFRDRWDAETFCATETASAAEAEQAFKNCLSAFIDSRIKAAL